VQRSLLALRGWIHLLNNEDLSKRPYLFFENKTHLEPICVSQSGQKPKGVPLDENNIFFKKFSDFNKNRLKRSEILC
jgi:hypothetical protein